MASIRLSIVSTIYNSESTIEQFIEHSEKVARALVADLFEIILVDDGSTDASLNRALSAQKLHDQIVIVQLSRNYGQHLALLAGLRLAKGAFIVCIDGDCDEDPEWITEFWKVRNETGADVVVGSQQKVNASRFYRTGRIAFLKLLGLKVLSNANETTARLMTRQVATALVQNKESRFYFGGVMAELGFQRVYVPVEKTKSFPTRYSPILLLQQVLSAITSFSTVPLRVLFIWGIIISSIATISGMIYGSLYLLEIFKTGPGWFSLMVAVTFLGGNVLIGLGIIGEYVASILVESKRRPQYHVRKIHRSN